MDLAATKKVLEIMKGVNITQANILVHENNQNQIRGITEDKTIVMFTNVPQFIETGVGLLSVNGLLTRLNLFDQEKMGVDLKTEESQKTGEDYVSKIVVKEGRRRSTVTTTDPDILRSKTPQKYPEAARVCTVGMTKEYVDYINKMKASVSTAASTETLYAEIHFDSETDEGFVNFNIGGGYDDFDDSIVAELDESVEGMAFSVQWKIEPFIRAIRQAASSSENDEFMMHVNDMGFLEIDIDGIIVSVAPMSVSQPE